MKEYYDLVECLRVTESQLRTAENRLNYATDELLIDSLIYEIDSLYKRYAYYLRLCKELNKAEGEGYAV